MQKQMRKKDRQLSKEQSMEILQNAEYGILSTIGESYPYAVPVNYVVVNDNIYIHGTCESGQKYENMKNNSKVCFTVVGEAEVVPAKFSEKYESVIVLGSSELSNKEDKLIALEEFINKYSSEYKENGMKYIKVAMDKVSVYKIVIEKITGKASK
ncbi:MAG: pyridoxamine 5'-phosphate oxidase family protein [Peptostreptococcaceae bacterium]